MGMLYEYKAWNEEDNERAHQQIGGWITQEQQAELDKWADTCDQRQAIEDFVQMAEIYGALDRSGRAGRTFDSLLDEFFRIDSASLGRRKESIMRNAVAR